MAYHNWQRLSLTTPDHLLGHTDTKASKECPSRLTRLSGLEKIVLCSHFTRQRLSADCPAKSSGELQLAPLDTCIGDHNHLFKGKLQAKCSPSAVSRISRSTQESLLLDHLSRLWPVSPLFFQQSLRVLSRGFATSVTLDRCSGVLQSNCVVKKRQAKHC